MKGFLKKSGLLSVIKPPQVQRIEQVERMHDEKMGMDSAKLNLENNKFEEDLRYKRAIIEQKERERSDKDRQHYEKLEQEKILAEKNEKHELNVLGKKQQHEEKLKEEDRKNAVAIEKIKGVNTKEIITHESETKVNEKELTERFLDSESERSQIENQAKARDDALAEILKIMAKGSEDRKTILLQAKLTKQGVDKDKIKDWIGDIKEDENE